MKAMGAFQYRLLCFVGVAGLAAACGSGEPRTDAERLARGRETIERMSAKLASADSFSLKTRETRDQIKGSGGVQQIALTRETIVRRKPDRLYSKTAGDSENEAWYDGVGITVVLHREKVFGQARMPETLDKTLDSMHERYGVALPVADFVYTSPAKALLTKTTTGGWVGRETLDGQPTDHLSFSDTGVKWQLWVASDGDPVPKKLIAEFTDNARLRKAEAVFNEWSFSPQIASDRFTPTVPEDYEGIAIVQRARTLRNMPKDEATATGVEVKK
jgi:hypothetical protein